MSRTARLVAFTGLMLLVTGMVPAVARVEAQAPEAVFDLARVPLAAHELPESGYQVLSGGYLDLDSAAQWIGEPRMRSTAAMADELSDAGWMQAYVLDLVLLEDRAYSDSDILGFVQTNVFMFTDESGAEDVYQLMVDYSGSDAAEDAEPAVADGTTVRFISQSGDTMRTVFQRDRTIVEVVTLEGFGFVDPEFHRMTAEGTLNRLVVVEDDSDPGITPRAARLRDGESLADLQNFEQSGVHHLYRLRDGVTQPAAGEVLAPTPGEIAGGLEDLYLASEALTFDSGTGYMSTWIGAFDSEASASATMGMLSAGDPSSLIVDPYFLIAADEKATSQGIEGVYRVTGMHNGQAYSGSLEIRQQGSYIVAIGFRSVGSVLPPVDVTSRVMDHQLGCLQDVRACPPIDLSDLFVAPFATPVVPQSSNDVVLSEEFGWSVTPDPALWTVTERFTEGGYDFVEMQAGSSLVSLESVINQHGDPQQCVIEEMRMLQELESSAVIDIGSDDAEENPAGSGPGHAWAIYTVEPLAAERADQEYTIRIDCYTIVEGGANLVITQRAPRDAWAGERGKGADLRDSVRLTEGYRTGGIIALTTHYWRCDVINRPWIDSAA